VKVNGTSFLLLTMWSCLALGGSARAAQDATATQAASVTQAQVGPMQAGLAQAGQMWELGPDEAVRVALGEHQELRAADAKVEAAEGLRRQAALAPNPRLTFQVENLRGDRAAAAFSFERDADTFLYGSQVFEVAGKRRKREAFFLAETGTRSRERDRLAAQIAARVGLAYWTAAGAAREQAVLADSRANFERIVQYHRDRVREGAMAEADLLRVLIEQDRLSVAVAAAEQEAARTRLLLFREMGVAHRDDVRLTGNLEARQDLPPLDVETAVAGRADVQAARQAHEQAGAYVRLQQANARPDPDVLVGYKRTAGFNTVLAGVQIDLPLRDRRQGAIAAATADARAADALAKGAEIRARDDIAAARAAYEKRRAVIEDTVPRLRERANESSRIAEAAYREGGTDLLRLLDAERTRLDADRLYFRALTDYQRAVVELKAALAVPQ
jgi:cobalt-zinc-cadmium efflux system outer membrane protein